MKLFRIYKIFRTLGYILSVCGLIFFAFLGPTNPEMKGMGYLLMAAGFGCIFVTYVIYLISRISK